MNRHTTRLIQLALIILSSHSVHASKQESKKIEASTVINLLKEYQREAVWFRDDHPLGQFTRVKNFTCSEGVAKAATLYNSKINEFHAGSTKDFPILPSSERNRLRNFLPTTWNALVEASSEDRLAANNKAILLSLIIRETGGDPFLEENSTSRFYLKAGTGLIQMTAIHKHLDGKPVEWAFDDFISYKEIYSEFLPDDTRLPASVSYQGKSQISTAEEFAGSAFNPFASIWYGNEKIEGQVADQLRAPRFKNAGFDFDRTGQLGAENRAAILGTVYNAGCHRLRCAVRRAQIWNQDSRTEAMNSHSWLTLRSFVYLDGAKARAAGVPSDLVRKLKNACAGQTDPCSEVAGETCSCLDNESDRNRSSPLEGYAWRGAIAMSYGDHIEKIASCFQ